MKKSYRICTITKNGTNPAYEGARIGMGRVASRMGCAVEHYFPKKPDDAVEQAALIEDALGTRPDAILLTPTHPTALNDAIHKIEEAGITLINFVSRTEGTKPWSFISSDNHSLAFSVAAYLIDLLEGIGDIAVIEGSSNSSTSSPRTKGFLEGIAAHPEVHMVAQRRGNYQREDAQRAIELSRTGSRPQVKATAGIHPHVAQKCTPDSLAALRELAGSDHVVAIGETGLDFYYDNAPRDTQLEAFRAQVELAVQLGLPVVVHSREADVETSEIVGDYAGRVTGVLHCFSAGDELLDAGLAADWYVSFSGLITFKSFAAEAQVRRVPESRLLVETDSPYLAPVPMRGRRNEPAFVKHVVERMAEIRGDSPVRLAKVTCENARQFYGLG